MLSYQSFFFTNGLKFLKSFHFRYRWKYPHIMPYYMRITGTINICINNRERIANIQLFIIKPYHFRLCFKVCAICMK